MAGRRITLSLDDVRKLEKFYLEYYELMLKFNPLAQELVARLSQEQELPPAQTSLVRCMVEMVCSSSSAEHLKNVCQVAKQECGVQLREEDVSRAVQSLFASIKKDLN